VSFGVWVKHLIFGLGRKIQQSKITPLIKINLQIIDQMLYPYKVLSDTQIR